MNPPLKGLILAGGLSQRLGKDKGIINYHGKPQREYMADLLVPFCSEVFISCRADQLMGIPSSYPSLKDCIDSVGPMGALISAFEKFPDSAFLVAPCDLPLLSSSVISNLNHHRDPAKIATVFQVAPPKKFEPLVSIWEPKAFHLLKTQFQNQDFSLQSILSNHPVKAIPTDNSEVFKNVNDLEDYLEVINRLSEAVL